MWAGEITPIGAAGGRERVTAVLRQDGLTVTGGMAGPGFRGTVQAFADDTGIAGRVATGGTPGRWLQLTSEGPDVLTGRLDDATVRLYRVGP